MTTMQKSIGDRAESDALEYLQQKGLRLLERNYTCFCGEIDLIMQDSKQIVFVEVRFRTRSAYGSAADSITPQKIEKLTRTATIYLQQKQCLHKAYSRFDVVAIDFTKSQQHITWYKNAFS